MKTFLLPACALLALAASASAEIIGVEQFDYADGAIAAKSGGTFWDYKNFVPTGHTGTPSTWDNVFDAPTVSLGRLLTSATSAKREYNGANEAEGAVNDPASVPNSVAKAVYYRVTVTTGATLPDFFGLSSYDFGSEIMFFGKTFLNPNFGLVRNGAAPVSSSTAVQPNTTYTLVTRLDYAGNTVRLYINPDLNATEPITPDAEEAFTLTDWSTAIRLASGNNTAAVAWDDLVVATTFAELNTGDTGAYYFVGASGGEARVVNTNGFPLSSVAGVPLARIVETERAVEFHFDQSLSFSASHRAYCVGDKPVRIVVNGNIVIPAGMVVSANSGAVVPGVAGSRGAGAGLGGAGSEGGKPGFIWPAYWALEWQADSNAGLKVFPHDYEFEYAPLIPTNGAGAYASFRGTGGAGGLFAAAEAGAQGGAGIEPGYVGADGIESTLVPTQRELDGISGLSGDSGRQAPNGGAGFENAEIAVGGEEAVGGRAAPIPFVPAFPVFNLSSGWGGTSGAGAQAVPVLAGFAGGPGGHGENGSDGFNAQFGRHGQGGKYPANSSTAPVLRGGGGGAGGSGGGGGEGGAAGGSGGGGGGGGAGYTVVNSVLIPVVQGGAGGQGGYGEPGGEGSAGRDGVAGGMGGGAFDLSATGVISIGGRLEAQGQTGQSANRTAVPGVQPAYPATFTNGTAGQNGGVSGGSSGGKGGDGGNGGQGGKGGTGGGGGHGGGGAGGTITLHARSVTFGAGNPASHIFVGGGAGGSGGDPNRPAAVNQQSPNHSADQANYPFPHDPPIGNKGADGQYFVSQNPIIQVAPSSLTTSFNRFGPQPAATPIFTVNNAPASPGPLSVRPTSSLPWVSFSPASADNIAPGASVNFQVIFDTSYTGGGTHAGVITVASIDPHSTATPREVALNVTVNGTPDDYGSILANAFLVNFGADIDLAGRLEVVGDEDWFEIPLSASRRFIEVESRGGTNTTGDLRNSAGTLIGTYEDAHSTNPNFRFEYLATESETRAFVVVRSAAGATGDYILRIHGSPDGRVDAFVRVEWINGNDVLFANGREGDDLRLVGTNDGIRWRSASSQTYSLGNQTQVIDLTGATPFENYALIQGEAFAHVVARITSSSGTANSAAITALTPDTVFTAGAPALAGKTALTHNGAPLNQDHDSTQGPAVITSFAGGKTAPWSFIQSPGNWTGGPVPGGFPNGAWLSSTDASGASLAGVPMGAVVFATPETWGTYLRPDDFSMNGFFAALSGWPLFTSSTNPTYLASPTAQYAIDKPEMFSATANLMVCGSSPTPTIVGTRPRDFSGWTIIQQDLNGNPVHNTQGCAIATVPFAQPYAAVGRVNADGTKQAGSENFSVRWDAAITGYRITPTGFGDLNDGVLLVNSHDLTHVAAMSWEVSPDGTQLLVYARRTPLSQGGFQQCGFAFAYFPADGLHFGPLLGVDFSDISVRVKGQIALSGFLAEIEVNHGQLAASRQLTVTNTGDGTLTLQVDTATIPAYLGFSPQTAMLPPGASTQITVGFNTASLGLGSYNPQIRFLSPDPSVDPVTLSFTLRVIDAPFVVTTGVDENDGVGVGFGTSLREAVAAALDGTLIQFSPDLDGNTLTVSLGEIVLNKTLRIDASNLPSGLAIAALNNSRIFRVPFTGSVLIDSLTLRNGNAGAGVGGAVLVEGGIVQFQDCTLINNAAFQGAAVFLNGFGQLAFDRCLVANNTASNVGGGVFSDGADAVWVVNSTFTGNTASDGAAVWSQGSGAELYLAHATITRNQGIFAVVSFSTTAVLNTIIADNSNANLYTATPPNFHGENLLSGTAFLSPLGSYGGRTQSIIPLPGSPAIEGGLPLPFPIIYADQRGNSRVVGLWPDIGAVEATAFNFASLPSLDGDLIPDAWEGPGKPYSDISPTKNDSTKDSDGDGIPDQTELLTWTNPFDPLSRFELRNLQMTAPDGLSSLFFTFPSVPGGIYYLDLDDDLDFSNAVTFPLGAIFSFETEVTVPVSGDRLFLRVRR